MDISKYQTDRKLVHICAKENFEVMSIPLNETVSFSKIPNETSLGLNRERVNIKLASPQYIVWSYDLLHSVTTGI